MKPEPAASRLTVLSDLHLAPAGEHCVFQAHDALVALIEHLSAAPAAELPQWLVLNGDVFDFLQIPGYDALSLPLAPQRMAALLDDLDSEPPQRNIVQALARFTRAGHVLSCLPGNHDPELNLVSVQQVLGARVGSSTALPPSAGQWCLEVAGRTVVGLHGHHADAFNAISSERMRQAQADGDATVPLPPGSRLVCEVINPFRRAKGPDGTRRFPFIDRLPSDQAVVLAIMLLDPCLAGKRMSTALGIGAAALIRRALMASGIVQPTLSAGPAARAASTELAWVDEWTADLADAVSGTDLDHELDAYFAGHGAGHLRPSSLARGAGAVQRLLWRGLAGALMTARAGFASAHPDRLAERMLSTAQPGTVTITGHTHAPKALRTDHGAVYLNTGTWLDQIVPPGTINAATLPEWLAQLQRDELPTWNGRPVGVVDGDGARLMHWNGSALVEWRDPPG